MLERHHSISLSLLTICMAIIGISHLRRTMPHVSAASSPTTTTNPNPNPKKVVHRSSSLKPTDRDSLFSTYNNPVYSLSFRYPRMFSLTEDAGDFGDDSSLKPQSQLATDQSGLLLVASLEIPGDAYPNTTFVSGHLQFAVNPNLAAPACRALAAPDDPDTRDSAVKESTGVEEIHGLIFHWHQSRSILNHMDYLSRDYFAFASGGCYEFFLETANIVPLPPDPPAAPATPLATTPSEIAPQAHSIAALAKTDTKSLHTLEKIVSTFELHH